MNISSKNLETFSTRSSSMQRSLSNRAVSRLPMSLPRSTTNSSVATRTSSATLTQPTQRLSSVIGRTSNATSAAPTLSSEHQCSMVSQRRSRLSPTQRPCNAKPQKWASTGPTPLARSTKSLRKPPKRSKHISLVTRTKFGQRSVIFCSQW